MYKFEYLARLRAALNGADSKEAEGLIEYYNDLIADGLENGKGEAFIDSLEPPELVAQNFLREMNGAGGGYIKHDEERDAIVENDPFDNRATNNKHPEPLKQDETPPKKQGSSAIVSIFLAICCVMFAFVGGVLLFTIAVVAGSIVLSGVFSFVAAFALLGTRTATAFAQLGFGVALVAAGVLIFIAIPYFGSWYVNTIRQLRRKEPKPMQRSGKKKLFTAFGLSFAVGVIVFLSAFGSIGFDGNKLAGYDDMIVKTVEAEAPTDVFNFVSDNLDLEIKYSDDGVVRLVYTDDKSNPKSFSYENGTAKLKSDSPFGNFGMIWKRGIFFAFVSNDYYKATLYLPQEISFDVGVELSNGKILIQNMDFLRLNLSTKNGAVCVKDFNAQSVSVSTENGAVVLENVSIDEAVTAKTENGAVYMKNVAAASITGETENGAVKLEKCKAAHIHAETENGAVNVVTIAGDEIMLVTDNGSVSGTISGSRSDYRIESKTSNGANNLGNKSDGSKLLSVRTSNGSINVTFVE